MRIDDVYPTKYLSAADLRGRPAVVKIDRVVSEKLDDGQKPVAYFVGKTKGFVLNKTNFKKLTSITGYEDSDGWRDAVIELYPAEVDYQGDTVAAIRVRAPRTETTSQQRPEPRHEAPREPARDDRYQRESDGETMTRPRDREVDDLRDPAPRRAAAPRSTDMDDEIPF
jgi:hypothetical protein